MASFDWHTQASSGASAYQDFLVPAMFVPLSARVVVLAEIAAGDRVLDVACGTGASTRAIAGAAGPHGTVTAVDLAEPMLAVARAAPTRRDAAPIAFLQGDVTALPVGDAAFDVAVCQQGFQFVPAGDRGTALRELRRALRPGGRVAVATWQALEATPFGAIADALGRHIGPEAAHAMGAPFVLADPDELRRLLQAAGFDDIVVVEEPVDCRFTTLAGFAPMALAAGPLDATFTAASEEVQHAITEEVAQRLSPYGTPDGGLRMTMTSNVALGVRPA